MRYVQIGAKCVGAGNATYVIGEIGFNHEGDLRLGMKMIESAAGAGVDAVKFQTYQAASLVLESAEHFRVIKGGELSLEDHQRLAQAAQACGAAFLSTPFSRESVDILEKVNVPAYKVASMDVTNLPLLRYIGRTGKPVLLSTGMATLGEIAEAIEAVAQTGNRQVILLHCISKYPAVPDEIHLRTIQRLREAFGLPVGYSDHTLGNATALAAVALGACVIEKHFTTDKTLPGPDHKISADPKQIAALVREIRVVEQSLGDGDAISRRPDRDAARLFRRGLFAKVDIPAGTMITEAMIKCVRPEQGLPPKCWDLVIGRTAKADIKKESPITWDLV